MIPCIHHIDADMAEALHNGDDLGATLLRGMKRSYLARRREAGA